MTAFADIDALLALFENPPKAKSRLDRLGDLLEVAADEIRGELGYDYVRSPTTGTRTWYEDTDGSAVLHAHYGIQSLESVSFSFDQGATFEALETTEYRLQASADDSASPGSGEPYFHLRMLPYGSFHTLPRGTGLVRLVGVTGWDPAPPALVEGNVTRARQLAFADPSYQGAIASDDQYGQPSVTSRFPDVTWKFIQREKQRFMACSL